MTNGFLQFPREIDAWWVTTMFILTAFSFEEYYEMPGLARGLFTPEQYEVARGGLSEGWLGQARGLPEGSQDADPRRVFDPAFFKASAYGRLLSGMHPYRWVIKTPVRMYYGEVDECLTTGLARLPMEYQKGSATTRWRRSPRGPTPPIGSPSPVPRPNG